MHPPPPPPPRPRAPEFLRFHAVFRKIWQNRMLASPGELPPLLPRENTGPATALEYIFRYP